MFVGPTDWEYLHSYKGVIDPRFPADLTLRTKAKLRRGIRPAVGVTMMLVIGVAALSILLPLGLFSFEVGRLQLGQKQLRVSTDSAALAAGGIEGHDALNVS